MKNNKFNFDHAIVVLEKVRDEIHNYLIYYVDSNEKELAAEIADLDIEDAIKVLKKFNGKMKEDFDNDV